MTFKNDRQKASVSVYKQDKETRKYLPGGTYGLYAGNDIKAADGTIVVKKDTLIEKVVTGTDGKAVYSACIWDITFFDTANGYSAGTSEEYLGKALKKNVARNQVVIASKVYFNEGRLSRQAIMREIDGTLSRLGTDYLDLYIIHRFDYDTPIEETMEALHDLVKAGKVRALGASAMYGYQFYNMQLAARDNGWTPFSVMENHYNLLYREDERELLPICKQMKVSLMPYSPLAAGHLARPQWKSESLRGTTDRVAMGKYDKTEAEDMQIVKRVAELAEKYNCKMSQIAIAWQWARAYAQNHS